MKKNVDKKLQIILIVLIALIITVSIVIFVSKNRPTSDENYEVIIGDDGTLPDVNYNDFEITDASFSVDRENNNTKIYLTIKK